MTSELVFITGTTGFIGSATALTALAAGYRLRICLRKEEQIPKIRALLSEYPADRIEFVIASDLTSEEELRGKLDDVDYVLHLASPLPSGVDKETYFGPAVNATLAVLREARRVWSIKKVVVTSSMAAFVPMDWNLGSGVIKEDNDWDFSVDPNADYSDKEHPARTPLHLYRASKLLANNETWKFWKDIQPHYDLVTLHPGFVYGHNLMQTTAKELYTSTNRALWNTIMTGVPSMTITSVHVQDVADAHIKALDPAVLDGSKYLLVGEKIAWSDVAKVVNEEYPDCGAKITQEIQGGSWPVDASKAETELGIKWRSMAQMVREVMDQQLGLAKDV